MSTQNTVTGGQTGQLSDEQIIAQLPPEMAEQYREWKRGQDNNPQTQDKDAAEENAEREKQVIRENRVAQNQKGEWRKFLEVVPEDADRIQEQSVHFGSIYESRKKQYWLTSGEDDWIPANENAVKNYLSVERNVPAAEMKGAVNFVTRYANVEYATQLAGY